MGAKRPRPFFASWRKRPFTASNEQVSNNDRYVISVVCVFVCFVRLAYFRSVLCVRRGSKDCETCTWSIYNKHGGGYGSGRAYAHLWGLFCPKPSRVGCGRRAAVFSAACVVCLEPGGVVVSSSAHCLCAACIRQSCLVYLRTSK